MSVSRNKSATTPDQRWTWMVAASGVSHANAYGTASSPIGAFRAAQEAAEREGFIAHNPDDNADCDCLMCTAL